MNVPLFIENQTPSYQIAIYQMKYDTHVAVY